MNNIDKCKLSNEVDGDGNPSGGLVTGVGIAITWQNGPLGRGEKRIEPNGAFVETVIAVAKTRLEFYQESKFNCAENHMAIVFLRQALEVLESHTKNRENREVEGTHTV